MQTTFSSTRRNSSSSINFIVPQGWHELSDKQFRYVYQLIAGDFATNKLKTLYELCSFFISVAPQVPQAITGLVAEGDEVVIASVFVGRIINMFSLCISGILLNFAL